MRMLLRLDPGTTRSRIAIRPVRSAGPLAARARRPPALGAGVIVPPRRGARLRGSATGLPAAAAVFGSVAPLRRLLLLSDGRRERRVSALLLLRAACRAGGVGRGVGVGCCGGGGVGGGLLLLLLLALALALPDVGRRRAVAVLAWRGVGGERGGDGLVGGVAGGFGGPRVGVAYVARHGEGVVWRGGAAG